jgi:glycosidase
MRCPPLCWLAWLLAALCISAAATASSRSGLPSADRATTPSRIADRPWEEEIVYTMYLGNFVDGNTSNNVMLSAYGPLLGVDSNGVDHGGYLGGDLDGVIQKLDYFADLGITTLFLSPVVQNDKAGFFGYYAGGYRARDYHAVDENLGTTDTLLQLIDQAHARGMRVMIDMPLSLCGIENPMNTAANAANGYFNGTAWGMRVWNADNPAVAAHLTEVAAFWRDLTGCDGLRLDSCQLLSNAFWTSFAAQVDGQAAPDNLFLMAELTSGPAVIGSFLSQTKFDSAYDFSFLACQGVFGANQNVSGIDFVTQQAQQHYPNPNRMCSEIDNYGDTFADKSSVPVSDRTKLALAFMLTMNRIPILYAGDEIGHWNKVPGDVFDPAKGDQSIRPYLRQLIALRKSHAALSRGTFTKVQSASPIFAYKRVFGGSTILVVTNNSGVPRLVSYSTLGAAWSSLELYDLMQDQVAKPTNSAASVSVPPTSAVILEVRDGTSGMGNSWAAYD